MKSQILHKQKNAMHGAKSLLAIVVAFCFGHTQSFAQMKVGNNPTIIDASSMLEVEATNQGILLPRISIGNILTWGLAGATPVNGMFVYNSNAATTGGSGIGIYYWATAKWNYLQNGANADWLLTGNSATVPGTYAAPGANFLGTIDNVDFAVRTFNLERMRISNTGQIGINQNSLITQQLAVTTTTAANTAIVGQNTAVAGILGGIGVLGTTIQSLGNGVKGTNSNAAGIAILGQNSAVSGTNGNGIGVEGLSAQAYAAGPTRNGYGVVALNTNASGTGLYAGGNNVGLNTNFVIQGSGASLVGTLVGGFGYSTSGGGRGLWGNNTGAAGYGIYGESDGASGYGVYGLNDNTSVFQQGVYGTYNAAGWGAGVTGFGAGGTTLASGTLLDIGVYGTSDVYGIYGIGDDAGVIGYTANSTGAGVFGINAYRAPGAAGVFGSQVSDAPIPITLYPTGGAGGSFTGNGIKTDNRTVIGVAGFANYGDNGTGGGGGFPVGNRYYAGGYFATRISANAPYTATTYAYVGAQINATQYKINGTGTVATIVKDTKNQRVNFFAPEAPEILFEDYGKGVLVNGQAHIKIDAVYAKNITVNEKHPLRVFIQLNGDCKGVFVTNVNGDGFDVVELQGGKSNVAFFWHTVGNRADEFEEDGKTLLSKNADVRMPPGPGPQEAKEMSQMDNNLIGMGKNPMKGNSKSSVKKATPEDPQLLKTFQDKNSTDKNNNTPPVPKKD